MRPPDRTVALGVALVGGVAFAALAWWLVPWDPVPGGPVQPVAATDVFTAEEIRRAEDYSRWARLWGWSGLAVSLLVAGWLGFTRAGASLVARLPGAWWVQVVLAVAAVELLVRLATLPFAAAGHHLRAGVGLSTQSWSGWFRDVVVSQALVIAITGVVVLPLVAVARRWRRWWPAVGAAVVAGVVLLGSFVYPLLVEPLFNEFEPLPDGELRNGIVALAERQQVELDDVLVADASRRTTTLNAYVSGLGATRRVVVYDTLVDDAERDQVLAVVAHELAHAAHQDVVRGTVLGMVGAAAGVGLLALVMGRWSRHGVRDPRSVPTLLAVMAMASVLAAPVENGISRQVETRADVAALEATQDPGAFVALQRTLALRSLADPTPPTWAQWWFGSHPTVLQRVSWATHLGSAGGRVDLLIHRVAGGAEQVEHGASQQENDRYDHRGDASDE